jgi:hypothetical protein
MSYVEITIRPGIYEVKTFQYRFQARTWLVAHGYWMQDGNVYTNPYTGDTARIESRRTS